MRSFAAFGVALGAMLALRAAPVAAQVALTAPDGQSLDAQSPRTRQVFEAMYGPTCAPRPSAAPKPAPPLRPRDRTTKAPLRQTR